MSREIRDDHYCQHITHASPDPETRNHVQHFEALAPFNAAFRACADSFLDANDLTDLVANVVKKLSPSPGSVVALACLGSDGRDENAACSPLDIIALVMDSGLEQRDIVPVSREIARKFKEQCESALFGEFEVKLLDRPLCYFEGDPHKIWPDRITDAQPLALIDQDSVNYARRILVQQLKYGAEADGDSSLGKKLIAKINDRIGSFKRTCKTGKQTSKSNEIVHFDLNAGCSHFDESISRNGIGPSSFKQSALRLVQSSVNKVLFKGLLREPLERAQELAIQLPANTVQRLDFFKAEGLVGDLPEQQKTRLQDNYKYFLWQYHRSEWSYARERLTTITVDAKEVKERMNDLIEDSSRLAISSPTAVSRPGGTP
jgi:hypothetical protein